MKIEDMKKELANSIYNNEKEIEALQNIVIKKKKDGTNYKRLSQAIEGGTVVTDYLGTSYETRCIKISYRGTEHLTCWIPVCGKIRDLPETDIRRKRFKTAPTYNDTYTFTPNEIQKAINDKIESDEKRIVELKETLENFDSIYLPLIEKAKALYDELKNVTVLNYEITEACQNMIRFGYIY